MKSKLLSIRFFFWIFIEEKICSHSSRILYNMICVVFTNVIFQFSEMKLNEKQNFFSGTNDDDDDGS